MPSATRVLLLGAGELGSAFLPSLAALPNIHVTLGVRTPSKHADLKASNINILALDLVRPSDELSKTFAEFDIIISATGFGQSPGTVTKLAEEILEAGRIRKGAGKEKLWFFPWQWGVDYDVTGDGQGLMPLFGEQKHVRDVLRAKAAASHVKWTIVSTGIFMSFLFEPFWGVVDREQGITVRALRSWDHKVTVTEVHDIGKVLARVVAGDVEASDRIVYSAGDTVNYAQLADTIERVAGTKVKREEWSTAHLENEVAADPDNLIKKYRLVFARDGVWWDKEISVNHKLQLPVTDVEAYVRKHFTNKVDM